MMQFRFNPMKESSAHAIANWQYEGIYAFYNMNEDIEDLEELLDPHNWADKYFIVTNEQNELVGFFSFEQADEKVVMGLGMRPDYTGRGFGQAFVAAGLAFARRKFRPTMFSLSVATFNRRAIHVYEKVGFKPDGLFMNETNGGQYEFLRMVRKA